jgi:RNA polymerase sigma-70 factor (ECF subfamily)
MAFAGAVNGGDQEVLLKLLAEDAVLIADTGPGGARYGRIRNVGRPVVGRTKIAALMKAAARQGVPQGELQERVLNGEPAAVVFRDGRAVAALLISVADGKIRHVFLQSDPERLRHLGPLN